MKFSANDTNNSIHKMHISKFWYRCHMVIGQVSFATSSLSVSQLDKNERRLFRTETILTLWNIGSQVKLTYWIGKLRLVTPPCVPEYHVRSWKVSKSFSALNLDRDILEQWKHLRCVPVDGTHRLIYNMIFFIRPWLWGQIFSNDPLRSIYSSFDEFR